MDWQQTYDLLGMTIDCYKDSSNGQYYPVRKAYIYVGFAIDLYHSALLESVAYPAGTEESGCPFQINADSSAMPNKIIMVHKKMRWVGRRLNNIDRDINDRQRLNNSDYELIKLYKDLIRNAKRQ
jgi:hypothetical protein